MSDFQRAFIYNEQLTTLMVLYYMPDHRAILQQFTWQFMDVPPKFTRAHRFLNYWKEKIEAPIREVKIAVAGHLIQMDWANPTMYSA